MKSLHERILDNLRAEREMAYAKKSLLEEKGMDSDKITDRLDIIEAAIKVHDQIVEVVAC